MPIALINVISQLGAGQRAQGSCWTDRMGFLVRHLETAGLRVGEIITIKEPPVIAMGSEKLRYLNGVAAVCREVYDACRDCLVRGIIPITIGGDHSLAMGSAAASSRFVQEQREKELGMLWVDAHVDMNTAETTPSGNIHGMALAALCGLGVPELTSIGERIPAINSRNVVCMGLRYADAAELPHLEGLGIKVCSMRDVQRNGVNTILESIFQSRLSKVGGIHLSLDLDALDPLVVPDVNTPFPGGLTFREVFSMGDRIAESGLLVSMDLVEHNPEKGQDKNLQLIMGELIASALGASAMP